MPSAVTIASSHRPCTSRPSSQRFRRWRCSSTSSAGARCAALASRAKRSLSHSQRRPSPAPCSPLRAKPMAQPSSINRFNPSRLPRAQNTLTGRCPSPRAASPNPDPLSTASTSKASSARRAPCFQWPRAVLMPSRSARNRARVSMRAARSPPAWRARRLASWSSRGPACSSRRRTASVSQRLSSEVGAVTRSSIAQVRAEA